MFVDHVGLVVTDLDAQVAWYRAAFGLDEVNSFEIPEAGIRGAFVVGFGDGVSIELLERRGVSSSPRSKEPNDALLMSGWGHICLRVRDVDETFAHLVDLGAVSQFSPRDAPEPGVRMAYLTDPEGNLVELLDRAAPVGAAASSK